MALNLSRLGQPRAVDIIGVYLNHMQNITKITIALFAGAAIFLGLFVFGKGQVNYTPPSGGQLYINQTAVEKLPVKLRPGSYEFKVVSPRYTTVRQTVRVWPFQTVKFEPALQKRNLDNILSSAIGAYGLYGPPSAGDMKWFKNDTWLAGSIGPGSSSSIALQYVAGEWKVRYFDFTGYADDLSKIPADIAAYVKAGQTRAAQQ